MSLTGIVGGGIVLGEQPRSVLGAGFRLALLNWTWIIEPYLKITIALTEYREMGAMAAVLEIGRGGLRFRAAKDELSAESSSVGLSRRTRCG